MSTRPSACLPACLSQPATVGRSNPGRHRIGSQPEDVHEQLRGQRGQRRAQHRLTALTVRRRCSCPAAFGAACTAASALYRTLHASSRSRGLRQAPPVEPALGWRAALPFAGCSQRQRRRCLGRRPLRQVEASALLCTRQRPDSAPRCRSTGRGSGLDGPASMVHQQQLSHRCLEARGPAAVPLPGPGLVLGSQPGEPAAAPAGSSLSVTHGRRLKAA